MYEDPLLYFPKIISQKQENRILSTSGFKERESFSGGMRYSLIHEDYQLLVDVQAGTPVQPVLP